MLSFFHTGTFNIISIMTKISSRKLFPHTLHKRFDLQLVSAEYVFSSSSNYTERFKTLLLSLRQGMYV